MIYYAGAPLVNSDGLPLGTLCVIDHSPKELNEDQRRALKSLARQVVALLELRKTNLDLSKTTLKLQEANQTLEQFAYVASHDLKSPLNNIVSLASTIDKYYSDKLDDEGNKMIRLLKVSAKSSQKLVEEILTYAVLTSSDNIKVAIVDVNDVLNEVRQNLEIPEDFQIKTIGDPPRIVSNKTLVYQIFQNIISNAIRYNDKPAGWISIEYMEEPDSWIFEFTDNGPGIEEEFMERVFQMFQSLKNKDRFGNKGTGIGLATVKKLIENLGGDISLTSILGESTTFRVKLEKKELQPELTGQE